MSGSDVWGRGDDEDMAVLRTELVRLRDEIEGLKEGIERDYPKVAWDTLQAENARLREENESLRVRLGIAVFLGEPEA